MKKFTLLFSSQNCKGCVQIKQDLERLGIDDYILIDVENGGAVLARELGIKSIPTLIVGKIFTGYPGSIDKLREKIYSAVE